MGHFDYFDDDSLICLAL